MKQSATSEGADAAAPRIACVDRVRTSPWPFLYSVNSEPPYGLVRNVETAPKPAPVTRVRDPNTGRLVRPKPPPAIVSTTVKAKKAVAPAKKGKLKAFDGAVDALVDIAAQWSGQPQTKAAGK